MYKRAFFSILLLVAACAFAAPGEAQAPRGTYGVEPLDRVLPHVRSGRPGRFYDAEGPFPDADGGYHYRIKWLTPDGRVIWLDTDARSGRVLGIARGDWREQGPPAFGPGDYGGPRGGGFRGRGPYGPPGGPPRGGPGNGWRGGPPHGGHWHGRGG
jgi:hypothetical protein